MDAIPELLEADAISGPQDMICRIVAHDTEHLQDLVNGMLANAGHSALHELHRALAAGPAADGPAHRRGGRAGASGPEAVEAHVP